MTRLHCFIGITAVWMALGCGAQAEHPELPIRSIRWMKLVPSDGDQIRRISGIVAPVDESRLSFEVGGRVERVMASLGDRVTTGATLAVLDTEPFVLSLRQAEAALMESEAVLRERRSEYERFQALYASDAASASDLDRKRAAFESARSRRRAVVAQLRLTRRDLDHATLRAPFDGVISVKNIDAFVEVAAGVPVFELDDQDRYEIDLGLPEEVVRAISRGDSVQLEFPSLGATAPGIVHEIGSRAGAANAFPAKIQISDAVPEVRPGITAEAVFTLPETGSEASQPTMTVPYAAVLAGPDNRQYVFAFDAQRSAVKKIEVEIRNVRGNEIQLAGGVSPGSVIATAGVAFLADGQQVSLLGASNTTAAVSAQR